MAPLALVPGAAGLSTGTLLQTLDGVSVATKVTPDVSAQVRQWFLGADGICDNHHQRQEEHDVSAKDVHQWLTALSVWQNARTNAAAAIARLAIAVAELKRLARGPGDGPQSAQHVLALWPHICESVNDEHMQQSWSPSRSAQGFIALPLCSIIAQGKIVELIRLHVWLPDGQRGNEDFAIHSHQPFAQSWILAGEGIDYQYDVQPVSENENATHSEYRLSWDTGKGLSKQYSAHQQLSTVANSHVPVKCEQVSKNIHNFECTYSIPAGRFHRTQVHGGALHATLFFFDASRGFLDDAPVLGPVEGDSFTQIREVPGVTPRSLANQVLQIQAWERCIADGERDAAIANWEHAKQSFARALTILASENYVPCPKRYRAITMGHMGSTNRRFGLHAASVELLESACDDLGDSIEKVKFSGELGTAYRHLDQLEKARSSFQMQYDAAKALSLQPQMCQAIGNIGMVNYQLWQRSRMKGLRQRDEELLSLAISQLYERLEICNNVKHYHAKRVLSREDVVTLRQIDVWTAIGFSRLALCLIAKGNDQEAVSVTGHSLEHSQTTGDPTVVAMSHFFHGLALTANNRTAEAFTHFNANNGCTPAIAFCKEPSKENAKYLQTIIEAGADLTLLDSQGYTALDYAVFNSDQATIDQVLLGLRRQLSDSKRNPDKLDLDALLQARLTEARLRKGYREVFQDVFRPILLSATDAGCISRLRAEFATEFHAARDNSTLFDSLRAFPYAEFARLGRLPKFTDGLTRELAEGGSADPASPPWRRRTVVFFSYRWLNSKNSAADDEQNTQYNRMKRACESFMHLNSVEAENLYLWIVSFLNCVYIYLHPFCVKWEYLGNLENLQYLQGQGKRQHSSLTHPRT